MSKRKQSSLSDWLKPKQIAGNNEDENFVVPYSETTGTAKDKATEIYGNFDTQKSNRENNDVSESEASVVSKTTTNGHPEPTRKDATEGSFPVRAKLSFGKSKGPKKNSARPSKANKIRASGPEVASRELAKKINSSVQASTLTSNTRGQKRDLGLSSKVSNVGTLGPPAQEKAHAKVTSEPAQTASSTNKHRGARKSSSPVSKVSKTRTNGPPAVKEKAEETTRASQANCASSKHTDPKNSSAQSPNVSETGADLEDQKKYAKKINGSVQTVESTSKINCRRENSAPGSKLSQTEACVTPLQRQKSRSLKQAGQAVRTKTALSKNKGPKKHFPSAPEKRKKRTYPFQPSWLTDYSWCQLNEDESRLLCSFCKKAFEMKMFPPSIVVRPCFVSKGFRSWNIGTKRLNGHEKSKQHRMAVTKVLAQDTQPITPFVEGNLVRSQEKSRVALQAIITTLQFLAKQGLAIRGHEHDDGNFRCLLKLRAGDIPELHEWLRNSSASYMSMEIQNEILRIMSHMVQRKIISEVKSNGQYCLIVDETSDLSGKEQVSICVRTVKKDLIPHEYFLGLYEVDSTTGENLTQVILDVLTRSGLSLDNLRGQCYDGARNMSGVHKGVAKRISEMQPLAVFIHCYAHSLNLAIQDTVKKVPLMRDALAVVNEVSVLIKASPKRLSQFKAIVAQHDCSSGLLPKPLCPTRFLYRARSIRAIIENYGPLLEQLEQLGGSNEPVSSSAHGLANQLQRGEMFFVMTLSLELMLYLESLSRQIQKPSGTLSGILESVMTVKNTLQGHGQDESLFNACFVKMEASVAKFELNDPNLPRFRKPTAKVQKHAPEAFASVRDYLRSTYQSVYKMAAEELSYRFGQDGVSKYIQMENLLLHSIEDDREQQILELCQVYKLSFEKITENLNMLKFCGEKFETVESLRSFIRSLKPDTQELYSELIKVLKLLLLFPVSSCTPERSFSAMKLIKSYLRTTMSQERLNHCLLLHLYSEMTEEVDVTVVMSEFINTEKRMQTFGK